MGACCSSRECEFPNNGINNLQLYLCIGALPADKRTEFKAELLKAVNKEYLHNEVLSNQQILDFDSYKSIMGLVSAYVTELSLIKNNDTFMARQSMISQNHSMEQYDRLISEICTYQISLQRELIVQVQQSLDIQDEQILLNSHDTYEERKQLFDHMSIVVQAR